MTPHGRVASTERAGRLLHQLLAEREVYRRRWQVHVKRYRSGGVSQAAIAQTLALHLWDAGEVPETQASLARDLKDRVRRALSGEVLSAETLRWFIEAFGIFEADASNLWTCFGSDSRPESVGVADTLRAPRPLLKPQRHRTIAVFEHRLIGESGLEVRHRTMHVISALEDGVDRYLYGVNMPGAEVRVVRGGRLGRLHPYGDGFQLAEVILTRSLQQGQTASLEYEIVFGDNAPKRPEMRRAARGRTENVDLVITFHPGRLPMAVWWTVWDDHTDGTIVHEEPLALDPDCSAHRFIPYIEQTVVGFRWQWPG